MFALEMFNSESILYSENMIAKPLTYCPKNITFEICVHFLYRDDIYYANIHELTNFFDQIWTIHAQLSDG